MKYNPGGCQNEGVRNAFECKHVQKLQTKHTGRWSFALSVVLYSKWVPFFFLPPNTFPSGYWVTSHCHSSLLLDLKMFEDGLVRLNSRCRQIRGTFQRERIPVCQTKCCIPARSQRKFVNDARNTQCRLQIPCISEAIIITLLLYTSSPTGTSPEEVLAFFWCFFWTQKASHCVSNDLICMHCPLQICVTVGLPNPPQTGLLCFKLPPPHLTLPPFPLKSCYSSYYTKSFLGSWNVKAGGVQWEN